MVKIRVRGGVTLLIFGKNLSDLSALNVLPQISELIFKTFFSVLSDLTKMSI